MRLNGSQPSHWLARERYVDAAACNIEDPAMPKRGAVLTAAIFYFGIIFALAFATGVVRVILIAPRVGALGAVLIEVPVILAASWIVAGRLMRGRNFRVRDRLAMGGIAFVLMILSEAILARALLGQSAAEWLGTIASPAGLAGLGGQLGFGAIPSLARAAPSQGAG
jgi:hypothetical protein